MRTATVAAPGEIDAEELVGRYTVEELALAAEAYFERIGDRRHQMAKPFATVDEAPARLEVFGALLEALELLPGVSVLDFGAGSCWMSHAFAQLGCAVVACDVSETALDIGRELFERQPIIGEGPATRFLVFDGRTLALGDETIDRVACMDAFHHVPNRPEVLGELFRVLKPGGRAVFAEPGPSHSRLPQSQVEMRNFTAVERDIVMVDIEAEARAVGFRDVQVAIYAPRPIFVDVADFDSVLEHEGERIAHEARSFLQNHRLFVLHKPGEPMIDSRRRWDLRAEIAVEVGEDGIVVAELRNVGRAHWLPAGSGVGEVNLGAHLRDQHGRLIDLDFQRIPVSTGPAIAPGEQVSLSYQLREVSEAGAGPYQIEFDLVAEGVAWFGDNGNETVVRSLEGRRRAAS